MPAGMAYQRGAELCRLRRGPTLLAHLDQHLERSSACTMGKGLDEQCVNKAYVGWQIRAFSNVIGVLSGSESSQQGIEGDGAPEREGSEVSSVNSLKFVSPDPRSQREFVLVKTGERSDCRIFDISILVRAR